MDERIRERWGAFDQALADDPYPLYARLHKEAPVTQVTLADGRPGWLVTGYDAARQVLSDPRLTKDLDRLEAAHPGAVPAGLLHPLLANHMLASDPPDHTRLRKLVSHAFTPARVEGLRPRVQAIADGLLDVLDTNPGEPVDLVDRFAFPLPIIVICELLGVPVGDRDRLRSLIAAVFASPMAPTCSPGSSPPATAGTGSARPRCSPPPGCWWWPATKPRSTSSATASSPFCSIPSSGPACRLIRHGCRLRGGGVPALQPARPPHHLSHDDRGDRDRWGHHPRSGAGPGRAGRHRA